MNANGAARLTRIKAAAPELPFLPNYLYDVPAQAQQARDLGIDAQFLGAGSWASSELLQACGSACEGGLLHHRL
jgi:hypothetical protein